MTEAEISALTKTVRAAEWLDRRLENSLSVNLRFDGLSVCVTPDNAELVWPLLYDKALEMETRL